MESQRYYCVPKNGLWNNGMKTVKRNLVSLETDCPMVLRLNGKKGRSERKADKAGEMNGVQSEWYASGQKRSEKNYQNNRLG